LDQLTDVALSTPPGAWEAIHPILYKASFLTCCRKDVVWALLGFAFSITLPEKGDLFLYRHTMKMQGSCQKADLR
jgi:hypothetical protein